MRVSCKILVCLFAVSLVSATTAWSEDLPVAAPAAQTNTATAADPLLQILVSKGVLSADEAKSLGGTPAEQRRKLLELLLQKGILSVSDYDALNASSSSGYDPRTESSSAQVDRNLVASTTPILPAATQQKEPGPITIPPRTTPPAFISAVAPVRTLSIDPPVKDGMIPAFKIGAIKLTPYGFLKATVVHDSSNPNGDDFPFPGIWLNSSSVFNTGPTQDPSFHIKARSSRFGVNFEWPDAAPKLTLTGRVEGDFEGGFTEVDNADVSSIRNPQPRLRLAYVRLDYAASENSNLFFEAGQNWTLFGSAALPNILETTFLGAYSGDIYERSPQFRFGLVQKVTSNLKISPEFALMMPSSGQIYKLNGTLGGFEAQIGEGEREGADSDRPEIEGKLAFQFPIDKAPGVAPAQIFWAGFEGKRTSITTSSNLTSIPAPADLLAQFPAGFTNSSNLFGNQLAVQLPTRWATLVVSAYKGGDMRFMLGGQLNTYLTDTSGLNNAFFVPTVDNVTGAAGGMAVGCSVHFVDTSTCTASGGTWKIAPQRPIGAFGGFVNLGFPLSRWFNADPKGHNAGWQLYLHAGKDQVVHHDILYGNGIGCGAADGSLACDGALPLLQSRLLAATIYYKLNTWATFAFEQSQYQTKGLTPDLYTIAGQPAGKWKDQRTEFGPIFTF